MFGSLTLSQVVAEVKLPSAGLITLGLAYDLLDLRSGWQ